MDDYSTEKMKYSPAVFLNYYKIWKKSNSNPEQKEIVVLGMHRSGTSLIAGWLNILGVNMGRDTHGASNANPKGFFEDSDFKKLNEHILRCANGTWDNPPSRQSILRCRRKFSKDIKKLIKQKSKYPVWGWKDPRTLLTIELYQPFLKNAHYIICFRNPLSVAASLKKREGRSFVNGLYLTSLYNKRISAFFKKNPTISKHFVNFENVFANPVVELDVLIEFVGINPSIKQYFRSVQFFGKKHRHF